MRPLEPVSLNAIREARERNAGGALRTPLVPLEVPGFPGQIFLKLENLQPIGSFKLRGAGAALDAADEAEVKKGLVTASAGNMALGVAWVARRFDVPCHVVVPETAPAHKIQAIERLGGRVIRVPFADWWRAIVEHRHLGLEGFFVHPVSHPAILAGHGAIGLEILEDLPDVDLITVPFGGGGLGCGIACAVQAMRPEIRVHPCEVETAAPLTAAWQAGEPVETEYTASFVEGVGGRGVLAEMWPLVRDLLAEPLVVNLRQVADAIRLMAEGARIIAEGAAATTLAAILRQAAPLGRLEGKKIVCVISGGQLGLDRLATILKGEIPAPRSL